MTEPTSEIVRRVLAGDLDQYRKIVRTYEGDVFRLAAPVLGSSGAAEDLTQEAFITAYRRLETFDPSEPFRPWLLGIASNLIRNEVRRRTREGKRLELYSVYLDAMSQRDKSLIDSEGMIEALEKCRQQLSAAASTALRGRYDDGLSIESLAQRLQRSVTATTQLLYRTRILLRACIESRLAAEGSKH